MAQTGMIRTARERIRGTGERLTGPRERVLAVLLAARSTLTHQDVEHALAVRPIDRVTLYRVLDWLVEQGLAHRIAGSDRVWRFGVAGETHTSHAHFECSRCGKVLCLEELSARRIALQLPQGCRPERMELRVTGVCAKCG